MNAYCGFLKPFFLYLDFHEPSQPAASPAAVPKNVIGQNQQQQYIPPPPPAPPSKHQAASTA
ncbi:unnamed protein product, partial [Rotaria sp. Silwood1]